MTEVDENVSYMAFPIWQSVASPPEEADNKFSHLYYKACDWIYSR